MIKLFLPLNFATDTLDGSNIPHPKSLLSLPLLHPLKNLESIFP